MFKMSDNLENENKTGATRLRNLHIGFTAFHQSEMMATLYVPTDNCLEGGPKSVQLKSQMLIFLQLLLDY